jgi:hypothetical protein
MKGRHQTPFTNVIEYLEVLFKYELFLNFSLLNFEQQIQLFDKEIKANGDERINPFYNYSPLIESEYLDFSHKTTFVFGYTIFEKSLKEFCEISQKEFNLQLSYKEIKADNDIDTYLKYLNKVVDINVEIDTDIHNYRKIRNLITHHLGEIVSENNKALLKFITDSAGIAIKYDIVNINEKEFVVNFMNLVYEIIEKIEKKLSMKYLEKNNPI